MGSIEGPSGSPGGGTAGDDVSSCVCWDEGVCWPGTPVTSLSELPHLQTALSHHFTPTPKTVHSSVTEVNQIIITQRTAIWPVLMVSSQQPLWVLWVPTVLSQMRKLKPKW